MESFTPHPPNDLAVYMFISFSRAFFTSNNPIDFFKNTPPERMRFQAKLQSFRARRILFDLYIYCQTTFASQPYQQTLITNAYLYAVATVHAKFQTNQNQSPFIPPVCDVWLGYFFPFPHLATTTPRVRIRPQPKNKLSTKQPKQP